MKHNIIKTENYLLVVGDSDAKIIAHLPLNNSPVLEGVPLLPPLVNIEQWAWDNPCLSRNDVYTLFEEVFKEKTFEGTYRISASKQVYSFNDRLRKLAKEKAITIKAKEKYKWTDEDLRNAFMKGISITGEGYNAEYAGGNYPDLEAEFGDEANKFIQSLQQPKMPVAFECELATKQMPDFHQDKPKTTTNTQGQTVLVGKYIY